jgi:hypothetical protein
MLDRQDGSGGEAGASHRHTLIWAAELADSVTRV